MIIKLDSVFQRWPTIPASSGTHPFLCLAVVLVNATHDYIRVLVITSQLTHIELSVNYTPPGLLSENCCQAGSAPLSSTYVIDFVLT